MELVKFPAKADWPSLMQRPQAEKAQLEQQVRGIMASVQTGGDAALLELTEKFDGVKLENLLVNDAEFAAAKETIDSELREAIDLAAGNISKFHEAQRQQPEVIETQPGVRCWRRQVGIEKVGLYIPGGTAPLFSSLLMLGIPAQLAGCREIVVCSPPSKDGSVHPALLYIASQLSNVTIFKAGGAQAIAAMTFGTSSIPAVDKIFGPGNQYVTKAKELAQQQGVAIDMPAGPSELLVIADDTAVPAYVAADLLSQAEHGPDSQVILLSDNAQILEKCRDEISLQLPNLPRKATAESALASSKAILLEDLKTCLEFSNAYAPEHLIIATNNAAELGNQVVNAGSVFLGNYSCESAGDYASGTNHTLPTNGYARSYSGVSLDSFCRMITYQELSAEGIRKIGSSIEKLAEAEGLQAHKNAVSIRLKDLINV